MAIASKAARAPVFSQAPELALGIELRLDCLNLAELIGEADRLAPRTPWLVRLRRRTVRIVRIMEPVALAVALLLFLLIVVEGT